MKHFRRTALCVLLALAIALPVFVSAQGTRADYDRAAKLREQWRGLTLNQPEPPSWIEKTHKFFYRKSVEGGGEYVLVDADAATKAPAFDQEKLAAALSAETKDKIEPKKMMLMRLQFVDEMKAITFDIGAEAFAKLVEAGIATEGAQSAARAVEAVIELAIRREWDISPQATAPARCLTFSEVSP